MREPMDHDDECVCGALLEDHGTGFVGCPLPPDPTLDRYERLRQLSELATPGRFCVDIGQSSWALHAPPFSSIAIDGHERALNPRERADAALLAGAVNFLRELLAEDNR